MKLALNSDVTMKYEAGTMRERYLQSEGFSLVTVSENDFPTANLLSGLSLPSSKSCIKQVNELKICGVDRQGYIDDCGTDTGAQCSVDI